MQESDAYFTRKDHKEHFPNKTPCRLINPSKTDIGKISKIILDKINKKVVEKFNISQWKNTSSVLDWFKSIERKDECSFIVFDIESFYPSITEKLFQDSLNFAKSAYNISSDDIQYQLFCKPGKHFFSLKKTVGLKNLVTKTLTYLWDVMMVLRYVN